MYNRSRSKARTFVKRETPGYARARQQLAAGTRAIRAAARAQSRASTRRNILGVEKKFYDTALVPTAIPAPTDATGGEFDPSATSMISTPAVGDSEVNRDGKRIIIKSVQITGEINNPKSEGAADPSSACKVFLALVQDTQTNQAQLNSEDVYKNTSANATLAADPMRNLLFGPRFKVLKTETFDLDRKTSTVTAINTHNSTGSSCAFNWFLPLEMPVNFNAGTTASVANVIDNSLHVIAYTSNAENVVTLAYNARIRFIG